MFDFQLSSPLWRLGETLGKIIMLYRGMGKVSFMLLRTVFRNTPQINFTFKIREYGFRDDGLKYWDAIKRYTRGILDIYYKSDGDIKEDHELQNWIAEVKVLN